MFNYSKAIFDWFKDDAIKLVYDHDLNQNSIVVDVGGYIGVWAENIIDRYNCNIIIYEPVQKYFTKLEKNISKYNKVFLYNYGLGKKYQKIKVQQRGVQTTTQKTYNKGYDEIVDSRDIAEIEIRDIAKEDHLIYEKIDLMCINIEGGEYELLERIIETKMIENIENIQVQFHEWYPSYKESVMLRNSLQDRLEKTHELTFCYPFVWENWKIKSDGYNYL